MLISASMAKYNMAKIHFLNIYTCTCPWLLFDEYDKLFVHLFTAVDTTVNCSKQMQVSISFSELKGQSEVKAGTSLGVLDLPIFLYLRNKFKTMFHHLKNSSRELDTIKDPTETVLESDMYTKLFTLK